jgi:hypothetical protein
VHARKSLIVAVFLLILGAYIYFFEFQKDTADKGEKLLKFIPDEIAALVINDGQQEIRLQKDDSGKWKITSPIQAGADESTVASVLTALSGAEVARTLVSNPSKEELESFGLERPSIKVSLTTKSGLTLPALLIGAKTPVGTSVYVKRETGNDVLLANASVVPSLQRRVKDFRDKRILEFKADAVKQLILRGARKEWVLEKKGDDWFVDGPGVYRADPAEVGAVLSAVRFMSAQDFIEGEVADRKRYGLDPPRLRLTLSFGDGQRDVYFGGSKEQTGEVYLALDSAPTIYTVRSDVVKMLDKDPLALRDKTILPFSTDRVAKLKIERPKDSFTLVKSENNNWSLEAPKKDSVAQETVAQYLRALRDLKAARFVEDDAKDLKRFGLRQPSLRISLETREGKNVGSLAIGGKTGSEYYARREDSPPVYAIDESTYRQIDKSIADFRKKPGKDESASPEESKKP